MGDFTESIQAVNDELACTGCGALLKFKPGTSHLACEYCGATNEIAGAGANGEVRETSLEEFLAENFGKEEKTEALTVKCDSCGAACTLDSRISSDQCPFCASAIVVKGGTASMLHKPQYLLPFGIGQAKARENFGRWLKSLWFAPNDLTHYANRADRLAGMYLPYWTFDCRTDSRYSGQRGEDYIVNESYTTVENGKTVTRTRAVTKTRWYPASGRVSNNFDDILIEATRSLPKNKLRALEPWDIKHLVPYDDKYLSGFRTETYGVDVKSGYAEAKVCMDPVIRRSIVNDIGGDRQLIHHVSTTYRDPSFKHILLPVWVSAYRYKNKVYQLLINARTGEVQGARPYSAMKIALAVLAGVLLIGVLIFLAQ